MNITRAVGFWILMAGGIVLLIEILLGQTMAFINYEFTAALGLQEARDIVGAMGVAVNKGFGVGDTIIYVPLLALGLVGLARQKRWGIFAMAGALTITAY